MQEIIKFIKAVIACVCGFISSKLGILAPLLLFLIIAMVMDYTSGMISAASNGELNSKRGFKGILKKLSYFLVIAAALITDQVVTAIGSIYYDMPTITVFGMMTIIWLILNELLSILENIDKIGIALPSFLKKSIKSLKDNVDQKADANINVDNN